MRGALLAAVAAVLALPGVAAACPVPTGAEITFAYTGAVQQVQVPAGVVKVDVYARGGHGGKESETAEGGQGGSVYATVPVAPGDCLDVYVGDYGGGSGGWGYGRGGEHGTTPYAGKDGAGGGGGSAIVLGSRALVAAGGGGGGGGGSEFPAAHPGGPGGDGANGDGPGTATGSDGSNPPLYPDPFIAGDGGGEEGRDGENGGPSSVYGFFTGAGGGGGGGTAGGSAGYGPPVERAQSGLIRGGGGGGGGSSYAHPDATQTSFGVEGLSCPEGGGPDCVGEVTLSWIEVPARVAAYGGSGQATVVGTRYPRPLQALVTSASGIPVPDVEVTFTLPASGPSAEFDEGAPSLIATVTTDRHGIASSPPLVAGEAGGAWSATAVAAGVTRPARFALHNAPATTMLALFSPENPSVTGEPVRFSAAVGASPSAAGTPSGVVEFVVDDVSVGLPVPLDGAGIAQSDPVELPPGEHTVEASFAGAPSFLPSEGSVRQQVDKASSRVALSSSANPAPASNAVTFSAHVGAESPGTGTPTGTVQFRLDDADLGAPVALVAGEAATAPVSGLDPGPHVVEAVYSGDGGYGAGSATLVQMTGDDVTATEIAVPSRSTPYGEPVAVTATVLSGGAGTPTGSVTFSVDGVALCGDVALDGAAEADCELPGTLEPGLREITAEYSGDGTFDTSEGRARHRVQRALTDVTVVAVPNPSIFGAGIALHADVAVRGPGAGTPGGAVQFLVDGLPVGLPVALGPDGASSDPIAVIDAGPHVIEVDYGGDTRFGPSARQAVTVVDPAETAATLSSSAAVAPFGAPVTFTMRLEAISPGAGTPEGTVRFRVDGRLEGPAVRVRDGHASSQPLALAPGFHDVRASFSGDNDWLAAEATLEQIVALPAVGGLTPVAPSPEGGGGGLGPLTPLVPSTGTSSPSRAVLCGAPFVVTRLALRGGRLHLAGRAQPELAGRRVAVLYRGRRLLRSTVGRHGAFRADARHARWKGWRTAHVRVEVAGQRSATLRLTRPTGLGEPSTAGSGRVQVVLAGPRRSRVVLEGRTRCGEPMRLVRRVRLDRRGRATVTLDRPAAGDVEALYRLRAARGAGASLPILVAPRAR